MHFAANDWDKLPLKSAQPFGAPVELIPSVSVRKAKTICMKSDVAQFFHGCIEQFYYSFRADSLPATDLSLFCNAEARGSIPSYSALPLDRGLHCFTFLRPPFHSRSSPFSPFPHFTDLGATKWVQWTENEFQVVWP